MSKQDWNAGYRAGQQDEGATIKEIFVMGAAALGVIGLMAIILKFFGM